MAGGRQIPISYVGREFMNYIELITFCRELSINSSSIKNF